MSAAVRLEKHWFETREISTFRDYYQLKNSEEPSKSFLVAGAGLSA